MEKDRRRGMFRTPIFGQTIIMINEPNGAELDLNSPVLFPKKTLSELVAGDRMNLKGIVVSRGNFIPFPVTRRTDISTTAKLVYGAIYWFVSRSEAAVCFAGQRTLAKYTRLPHRSVRRALAELKKAQLIRIEQHERDVGRTQNHIRCLTTGFRYSDLTAEGRKKMEYKFKLPSDTPQLPQGMIFNPYRCFPLVMIPGPAMDYIGRDKLRKSRRGSRHCLAWIRLLYGYVLTQCLEKGYTWVSKSQIAFDLGASVSTVYRGLKRLEQSRLTFHMLRSHEYQCSYLGILYHKFMDPGMNEPWYSGSAPPELPDDSFGNV